MAETQRSAQKSELAQEQKPAWRRIPRRIARAIWAAWRKFFRPIALAVLPFLVVLFAGFILWRTDRDVAYRYSEPGSPACNLQPFLSTALASDNDELAAIERDEKLRNALTCMIQLHEIPRPLEARMREGAPSTPLRFHLAFLEFTEGGQPADTNQRGDTLKANQLSVLIEHIRRQRKEGKSNYVIAFIHGWRHDARVGDTDIQKLRLFAAYADSFLEQRCAAEKRYCNVTVTAVYLGWRGARVDETWITRNYGKWLGAIPDLVFGKFPAIFTLFDRKPVSERIGPTAITALRRIDTETFDRHPDGWKRDTASRLITFGHSLGGNMLAATLRETMIDRIARHTPGSLMTAPFGDLIVLLNPASEAANWTALQRAMRERIRFLHYPRESRDSAAIDREAMDIGAGHDFFPDHQPPAYISLGSANTWPAGGLRKADARFLWNLVNRRTGNADEAEAADRVCQQLDRRQGFLRRPHYDWATHDLFPAFKWDFRPVADLVEALGHKETAADICQIASSTPPTDKPDEEVSEFWILMSGLLRNFPFMNTDVEQTRTIGHMIPTRSPIGTLASGNLLPSTHFGTTHELVVNLGSDLDADFLKATYYSASIPSHSECAVVDGWLIAARKRAQRNGMYWDSGATSEVAVQSDPESLTPVRRRPRFAAGRVESQFRHGLQYSGMATIVRANDPFWNVRVFETAMQDHGGYDSYPLICAIHQLVMDRIAAPDAMVRLP